MGGGFKSLNAPQAAAALKNLQKLLKSAPTAQDSAMYKIAEISSVDYSARAKILKREKRIWEFNTAKKIYHT